MVDNKHKVRVLLIFNYMDEGFKIVKLKFPAQIKPIIGMNLKDVNNIPYVISGIVFENKSDGMWDCKLKDNLDNLILGLELYIGW